MYFPLSLSYNCKLFCNYISNFPEVATLIIVIYGSTITKQQADVKYCWTSLQYTCNKWKTGMNQQESLLQSVLNRIQGSFLLQSITSYEKIWDFKRFRDRRKEENYVGNQSIVISLWFGEVAKMFISFNHSSYFMQLQLLHKKWSLKT